MKKSILVIILLSILLVSAIVFGVILQNRLVSKSVETALVNEEVFSFKATATKEITDLQKELEELQFDLEELESAKLELETTNITLSDQVDGLIATNGKLESDLEDIESLYSTSQNNLSTLQNSIMCSERPSTIDFTSNSTVSADLKKFIDEPSYKTATWEAVWGNAKVMTHTITGEYLYEFIVYFNEPSLGFTEAIFDIGNLCWLSK